MVMSFYIASIEYGLHWLLDHFAVKFHNELSIYHSLDDRICICQKSTSAVLIEKTLDSGLNCDDLVLDNFNNPLIMCKSGYHRMVMFSESFMELVSCEESVKWVLGLDVQNQTLFLSDDFVFKNESKLTGYMETAFVGSKGISIRVGLELFKTPSQWQETLGNHFKVHTDERNLRLCESFSATLDHASSLQPFVLVSDSPITRWNADSFNQTSHPWSLSYWIDFCGLLPTIVHTWELLPSDLHDDSNDDVCNVKYVTNGRYIDGSKRKSVVCLSDVMDEEYQVLKGDWSEHCEIEFVSSLGLIGINEGLENRKLNALYYSELATTIRAFLIRQRRSSVSNVLNIRSLSSGVLKTTLFNYTTACRCEECSIQSTLMDLMLIYTDDSDSDVTWNKLIEQLQCIGIGASSILSFQYEILVSLRSLFTDENLSLNRHLCDDGNNLICREPSLNQLKNVCGNDSLASKFLNEILNKQSTISTNGLAGNQTSRPDVLVLKDGLTYVLIYVLPQHVLAADTIVQSLQAGASHEDESRRTAHVFLKYLIVPIAVKDHGGKERPSIRAVLIHIRQFITDIVTVQDVVVMLVGLEALRAFLQPAREDSSVIPNCLRLGSCFYNLDAPIMVAYGSCISEQNSNDFRTDYDFSALIGIGTDVWAMLDRIRRHALYPFSSDDIIRTLLKEYAVEHPLEVNLDVRCTAFCISSHRNISLEVNVDGVLSSVVYDNKRKTETDVQKLFAKVLNGSNLESCEAFVKDQSICQYFPSLPLFRIETPTLNEVDSALNVWNDAYMIQPKWFAGTLHLIALHEPIRMSSHFPQFVDDFVSRFIQISRNSKYFGYFISHDEFRHTAQLMKLYERLIQDNIKNCVNNPRTCSDFTGNSIPCICNEEYLSGLDRLVMALSTAPAALYQETGSYDDMMRAFRASLNPERYSVVRQRREQWQAQRAVMQAKYAGGKVVSDEVKVHFATYSTNASRIETLALSANLSLISLVVLSWPGNFRDCSEKISGYYHCLQHPSLKDDDIMVFIDAYDVLLLPRARQIGSVLAASEAPIMFCAEAGIYPDFASAFMYHRGSVNSNASEYDQVSHMSQKFLNSGAIAGRVGQLRHMFAFAQRYGSVFRDDQQVLVYYMLKNPDMVKIDTEHTVFLTTFKMSGVIGNSATWDMTKTLALNYKPTVIDEALQPHSATSIGIIHCNNRGNNNFYSIYSQLLDEYARSYFRGEDGLYLVHALNAVHDKDFQRAKELLSSDVVSRNRTSLGGSNSMGDILLEMIV